jgi:acyl carrier protein
VELINEMRESVPVEGRLAAVLSSILAKRSIERPVSADDNLREIGLTSLDMINLVISIEAEFGVQFPEAEITPANFRSIRAISTLLATLLNQPSGKGS